MSVDEAPVRRRTVAPARVAGPRRAERLRVALFTGNYNYMRDGASQAIWRLVQHLEQDEGAEVRIYSPTTSRPAFDPERRIVSVPAIRIPGRSEYRVALGLPAAARADVHSFRPDVFHLATPDFLGSGALKLAREIGVPVVSSLHTRFESYFDYYGLGWLKPWAERRQRAFYEGCDYVLAPNAPIADRLAADGLHGRVRLWSRGVDRIQFDPARRDLVWRRAQGWADSDVVVAFFGRVVLEKGPLEFADVIDRVRAAAPDVRALVIGDGPAREMLERRLPDARFTGFLSGPELGRAVASADILLNPSITEAFGNVTLEAMAAGLAVVCADAPSHRALVTRGVSGLLCPPADVGAYARSVLELAANPVWCASLGRAARKASEAFSWPAALSSVVEVYREALDSTVRAAA
jgi:glycosyltransferase involved in cell wall biosynthesis